MLGNGIGRTPNQSFTLKQTPLTYVQAPTPTGRQSTLQVQRQRRRVDRSAHALRPSPTGAGLHTLNQPDGATDVLFGDGVEGATLPTGQNNIMANYRVGSGSAGNVAAGAITTLVDRPLGVSGVINPEPATGGQDPQSVDDIRTNAPQSVLTLGRAVSINDYQNLRRHLRRHRQGLRPLDSERRQPRRLPHRRRQRAARLPPGNLTLAIWSPRFKTYGNPLIPIYGRSPSSKPSSASTPTRLRSGLRPAVSAGAGASGTLTQTYSFRQPHLRPGCIGG